MSLWGPWGPITLPSFFDRGRRTLRGFRKWTRVPQAAAEPDLHLGDPPPGSRVHLSPTPQAQQCPPFALGHSGTGKDDRMNSNRRVVPPQTENSKPQLKFVFPIYLMHYFSLLTSLVN